MSAYEPHSDFVYPDEENEDPLATAPTRREPTHKDLVNIIESARTWECRANMYSVLRWMFSRNMTQRRLAKRLKISERRVRQIVRKLGGTGQGRGRPASASY